jgi:Flp pilus assembly pilin Flp
MLPPRHVLGRRADDGSSAVEHALLVAAIAAVVIAAVLGLAGIVQDAFGDAADCAGGGTSADCPARP